MQMSTHTKSHGGIHQTMSALTRQTPTGSLKLCVVLTFVWNLSLRLTSPKTPILEVDRLTGALPSIYLEEAQYNFLNERMTRMTVNDHKMCPAVSIVSSRHTSSLSYGTCTL